MAKVCLILMDGVGFEACVNEAGYLEGAVLAGEAARWKMLSSLPSISVPCYEAIHTGLPPQQHGILGNEAIRSSACENLFSILKAAGKTTGVVGHYYFHTLYGGSPFDFFEHCEIDDPAAPIPHARYYSMEGSIAANACLPSEIDLCAQTWKMAINHQPDYLLMHSPSADTLGHLFGGDSSQYRIQVWYVDNALSRLIPRLIGQGYDVIVTADHGLNADGHHGGNQPVLREVPFYYFGNLKGPNKNEILNQCAIAPSVLSILDVPISDTMKTLALFKEAG